MNPMADRLAGSLEYAKTHKGKQKLYVAKCQGFYKIGVAWSVKARIAQMQIGCPFPIVLIAEYYCLKALVVEASLHWRFQKYRERGEWFKLPPEEAAAISDYAIRLGAKSTKPTKPPMKRITIPTPVGLPITSTDIRLL